MTRIAQTVSLIAVVSLAACGAGVAPIPVDVSAAGKNLGAAGQTPLNVRATQGGRDVAATCTVSSVAFSATLTTPAAVQLPVFAGENVTVSVSCTFEGASGSVRQTCLRPTADATCTYNDAVVRL